MASFLLPVLFRASIIASSRSETVRQARKIFWKFMSSEKIGVDYLPSNVFFVEEDFLKVSYGD